MPYIDFLVEKAEIALAEQKMPEGTLYVGTSDNQRYSDFRYLPYETIPKRDAEGRLFVESYRFWLNQHMTPLYHRAKNIEVITNLGPGNLGVSVYNTAPPRRKGYREGIDNGRVEVNVNGIMVVSGYGAHLLLKPNEYIEILPNQWRRFAGGLPYVFSEFRFGIGEDNIVWYDERISYSPKHPL